MTDSWSIEGLALDTLKRNFLLIAACALVFGALATAKILTTPPIYSTDATLLYRFGKEYFPIAPGETQRNWSANVIVSLDEALATEMHLLLSYHVASSTVASLGKDFEQTKPQQSAPVSTAKRLKILEKNLKVNRINSTTMVRVTVHHSDPEIAENLLNASLHAYLLHRKDLFHSDTQEYFDSEIEAQMAKRRDIRKEIDSQLAQQRQMGISLQSGQSSRDNSDPENVAERHDETARELDHSIKVLLEHENSILMNLSSLRRLYDEWRQADAFIDQVSPSVEVADRRPAEIVNTGSSALFKIAAATSFGAVIAWIAAIIATTVRGGPKGGIQFSDNSSKG